MLDHVRSTRPELAPQLAEYAGEARFGASIIDADVSRLPVASRVLEVGAGPLLLSCALQRSGYEVVALEPIESGFSHMDSLRQAVLEFAGRHGCAPELRTIPAERLDSDREFDFAFSINVMEHVADVAAVLRGVWRALRPGAAYRFVCPNYAFPYEPHFDIPTLFSKRLTGAFFGKRITGSRQVIDPNGTWNSLNWISVGAVRRICRQDLHTDPEFDQMTFYRFVRRAIDDPAFQRRHAGVIGSIFAALDAAGLTRLFKQIPVGAQPAMSCRLVRPE